MIFDIDAYVLAGGKSNRMGTNKALLEWKGKPLVNVVYDCLKQLFEGVFIVTKSNSLVTQLNMPFVLDSSDMYCSIIGLHTALNHTQKKGIFIVSCDMPLINTKLVESIVSQASKADVVVPRTEKGIEPIFGYYSKKCFELIDIAVNTNNLKIKNLYDKFNVNYIEQEDIKKLDPEYTSFLNLNTPDDYKNFCGKY